MKFPRCPSIFKNSLGALSFSVFIFFLFPSILFVSFYHLPFLFLSIFILFFFFFLKIVFVLFLISLAFVSALLLLRLLLFVFFLLLLVYLCIYILPPFFSSASSCFLPASFSSFFSLFSFYTTISSPCVDYLFYVCPLFSHPLLPPFHHLCGRLNQRPSPDGGRFSLFLSKALLMVVIQPLFSRLSSLSGAVRCLFIGSCLYLQHCLLSTSGCLRLFVG